MVGAARTAEELGRAFPGVPVRHVRRRRRARPRCPEPALVVATPGAEPVADGGYAAALLLDGWALLGRPDLRAGEEALRRWLNAAAPWSGPDRPAGWSWSGRPGGAARCRRWSAGTRAGYADRELAERAELGFPPAVADGLGDRTGRGAGPLPGGGAASWPAVEVLGPVPVEPAREGPPAGRSDGQPGEAVRAAGPGAAGPAGRAGRARWPRRQAARSARKEAGSVRVQVDPLELG